MFTLCWQSFSLNVHSLRILLALKASEVFSMESWNTDFGAFSGAAIGVRLQQKHWSKLLLGFHGVRLTKESLFGFRHEMEQFSVPGKHSVWGKKDFFAVLSTYLYYQSISELLLTDQDCFVQGIVLAWNLHHCKTNLPSWLILNQLAGPDASSSPLPTPPSSSNSQNWKLLALDSQPGWF